MSDIVVTLPKSFGLKRWIEEGDPAGEPYSGTEWGWFMGGNPPKRIEPGERVYVVYSGHLIGYSPLLRIEPDPYGFDTNVHNYPNPDGFALVRGGDAVAVTIKRKVPGFQGYRYRWWNRNEEFPFPGWKDLA